MAYRRKDRPLTAILKAVGDERLPDSEVRRKEALAQNVWNLAIFGKIEFPDDSEDSGSRVLKASVKDWKDSVQWLYNHCEGPFVVDPAQTKGLGGALSQTPLEELQKIVAKSAEGSVAEDFSEPTE